MKLKKTRKILYCSPNLWKKIFLFRKNSIFKTSEKLFYTRSSIIPKIYINSTVLIYSGKRWHKRLISRWMVGFKVGEFTWNRRIALYKAKQLRKKNKKNKNKIK